MSILENEKLQQKYSESIKEHIGNGQDRDIEAQEESDRAIAPKEPEGTETDSISSKLIKDEGQKLHFVIFKLCKKIWKGKWLPLVGENFRSISLLNASYKIFSKNINELTTFIRGEDQCGIRKSDK